MTNERGEVRERMGDKFRQINKFVEIVGGLFDASRIKDKERISIVDMGAGKGYLTFAVYDYFSRMRNLKVSVTGVEARPELVQQSNEIARAAGFDGLRFERGYIHDFTIGVVDILIALHACDTATDDALFKGITARAEIIITAPCCHKEVRPQIKRRPCFARCSATEFCLSARPKPLPIHCARCCSNTPATPSRSSSSSRPSTRARTR